MKIEKEKRIEQEGQRLFDWFSDLCRGTDAYAPDLEDCVEFVTEAINYIETDEKET